MTHEVATWLVSCSTILASCLVKRVTHGVRYHGRTYLGVVKSQCEVKAAIEKNCGRVEERPLRLVEAGDVSNYLGNMDGGRSSK